MRTVAAVFLLLVAGFGGGSGDRRADDRIAELPGAPALRSAHFSGYLDAGRGALSLLLERWTKFASIVYLNTPDFTSFSYFRQPHANGSQSTAEANYAAINFGGLYVSVLSAKLLEDEDINLKGIGIGNGVLDEDEDLVQIPTFLFHHGIIDQQQFDAIFEKSIIMNPLFPPRKQKKPGASGIQSEVLYKQDVRSADSYLKAAIEKGVRVLLFYGDMDAVCPFLTAQIVADRIGKERKERRAWPNATEHRVFGFLSTYERLSFATIIGAGHNAVQDKPKETAWLVQAFLNDTLDSSD
ncbi:Carboxypeptidase [Aphelenchoides fujianensis]|nr:Carboxypeptidase [Aphelenchoides fujianensis]